MLRTIILPAVVVAIGILAALPFRRTPSSPSVAIAGETGSERADTGVASLAGSQSMRVPSSVTPLNLAHSAGSEDPASLLENLSPIAASPQKPGQPSVESLPASYEEIAVPLADRDMSKNLLRSGDHFEKPGNREPKTTVLTGSRWAFDRFGIPRPMREIEADRYAKGARISDRSPWNDTEPGSIASSDWTAPQPLAARPSAELILASQQKQQKARAETETSVRPTGAPQNSGLAESQRPGVNDAISPLASNSRLSDSGFSDARAKNSSAEIFQPVRAKVKLHASNDLRSESSGEVKYEDDNGAIDHRARQAAVRERHWIYEPKS